jgi:hypothetical protein
MTTKRTTAATADVYDALTLAIEQSDALASFLEDQLRILADRPQLTPPFPLHALSIIARTISDKHQIMLEKAIELDRLTKPSGVR